MSSSVGILPMGVDLNLYCPFVRFLGGGLEKLTVMPFPSPFWPWHCAQFSWKRTCPRLIEGLDLFFLMVSK